MPLIPFPALGVFFIFVFLSGCITPTGSDSTASPLACTESWACSDFGPCLFGTESRICLDSAFCGTGKYKPAETRACGETIAPDAMGSIRIIRDKWGVANVIAETDEGAMFGQGYATAEDRLFQMQYVRRLMQGRLAELIGNDFQPENAVLDHDKLFRLMQYYHYASLKAVNLAPETQKMLQAYADGVNAFVRQHPEKLNPLFEGQVPEPWTLADELVAYDYFQLPPVSSDEAGLRHKMESYALQLGSESAAVQRILEESPRFIVDDPVAVVQQSDVPGAVQNAMVDYASDHPSYEEVQQLAAHASPNPPSISYKFSQGWAVGGARSTTGNTLLFGHPQLVVKNPNIWYEIHVQGKTFNARGIGLPGSPGFVVGFTPQVAWTMTALGTDMSDLIRLEMETPSTYRRDGKVYSIASENQVIGIKNGTPVSITLKRSPLGPIVTPFVPAAKPGEEYVGRTILNWELDHHTIESLLAMMRAKDAFAFGDAIQYFRTPSLNCVFSDSSGNVGYWALAGQITRSSLSPLAGRVAIDGSDSRYDWVEITPAAIRPHVINPSSAVSFSANHLAVGSWYPIRDSYIGGDNDRSWRLRELLLEDAPVKLSPQNVKAVSLDTVTPFKREIVHGALQASGVQHIVFSPNAEKSLAMLKNWYARGATGAIQFPEDVLASYIPGKFRLDSAGPLVDRYGPAAGGLSRFLKDVENRLALNPNAVFDGPELEFFEWALSTAWKSTAAAMGSDPAKWVGNFRAGPGTADLHYMSSLWEDFGSLDPSLDLRVPGFPVDNAGLNGPFSNSYSQFVDFADVDSSEALLPPAISEHPDSIGYAAQIPLWVNSQLRPAPLSASRVEHYKAAEYWVSP